MPVENGAGFLTRRTQAIVHAAVVGDEAALEAALAREDTAVGETESEAPCTCEPLWTGEAPPVPDRHCAVHGEGTW